MTHEAILTKDYLSFHDSKSGELVFQCTFEKLRAQALILQIKYSEYIKQCINHLLNHFSVSLTAVTII